MSTPPAGIAEDRVVVGVDGSDDSVTALRAAARAAEIVHATLVVVTTWLQAPTFGRTPLWLPDFQRETEQVQDSAIRAAFGENPPAGMRRVVRGGTPGAALVHQSEGARLVVVGRRGHGGFGALLLGSTAMSTVVHAACSVLVLGQEARVAPTSDVDAPGSRRVVVGVDGDPPSIHALAAADRAAALLEARLDVVTVWPSFDGDLDVMGDLHEAIGSVARAQQDAAIEQAVPPGRRSEVRRLLRQGGISAALVEESMDADLLVIGVRSRSTLVEAFTGAVALTTAAHAACPVLVVRPHREAPPELQEMTARDRQRVAVRDTGSSGADDPARAPRRRSGPRRALTRARAVARAPRTDPATVLLDEAGIGATCVSDDRGRATRAGGARPGGARGWWFPFSETRSRRDQRHCDRVGPAGMLATEHLRGPSADDWRSDHEHDHRNHQRRAPTRSRGGADRPAHGTRGAGHRRRPCRAVRDAVDRRPGAEPHS